MNIHLTELYYGLYNKLYLILSEVEHNLHIWLLLLLKFILVTFKPS